MIDFAERRDIVLREALRKGNGKPLSSRKMKDIMDTVDPDFWPRWKKTLKRVDARDDVHVICDYCGKQVTIVSPIEDGRKVICSPCTEALFLEFVTERMGDYAAI